MPQIAYLGQSIDHLFSMQSAMRSIGQELVYVPDSYSWLRRNPGQGARGIKGRIQRIQSQFFETGNEAYLAAALKIIDENDVDRVIAYWGTLPLPDIRALKKRRPHVRFALNLLCHPLALDPLRVRLQRFLLSRGGSMLSGFIASSNVMRDYVHHYAPGMANVPTLVHPPKWTREYASTRPLEPLASGPNVLFFGRTDWNRGQASDNVSGSLIELMDAGIDVHYCRSSEADFPHPHALPFDAMPLRETSNFAARFDASLIVYNVAQAKVKDRFAVTVPDRLIASVCAGLPVALPSSGYDACEEYLRPYGAVLRYATMPELAAQLRDRPRVDELRHMARERSALYVEEDQVATLVAFLDSLSA